MTQISKIIQILLILTMIQLAFIMLIQLTVGNTETVHV